MTAPKVTFDFFDMTPPNESYIQMAGGHGSPSNSNSKRPEKITISSSTSDMKLIDSTSSINSLFDNVGNSYSKNTTTATSPVISRVDSNFFSSGTNSAANSFANPYLVPRLSPLEFTSLVNEKLISQHEKLVIMLSGLPASGKSTISRQLKNYINATSNFTAEIYNAGNVRRMNKSFDNSDYFKPDNVQGKIDREKYADITVNNLINDLNSNVIQVGFLDATNTTIERRKRMMDIISKNTTNTWVAIMDVQCTSKRFINFNISGKAHNNDYKGRNYAEAVRDFKKRSEHYYKVFEPITSEELELYPLAVYLKIVNCGESFELKNVDPGFKEYSQLYKVISEFASQYYENEGKRYTEAVDAFYNNSINAANFVHFG
ncbi:hypothetical protein G9P44_005098 [Scheffersomyces stipitis]|nr:hypothetical protein G9P44_005098 [Scheffersomyces stipitis]